MEKITFADVGGLLVETYTKEHVPATAPAIEDYQLYSDKKTRLLLTADEIPFVFYVPRLHAYGAAKITTEEVKNESPLKRFKEVLALYSLKPSEVCAYLGPSLTFSHVIVERPVILDLIARGYRAATKRTDGIDFFDVRMMLVVMLRKLGLDFKNIYLDGHDTFECDSLLYSALRGDNKKNPTVISVH
jgi:copper oxidase (laccase) domain-containing protein